MHIIINVLCKVQGGEGTGQYKEQVEAEQDL